MWQVTMWTPRVIFPAVDPFSRQHPAQVPNTPFGTGSESHLPPSQQYSQSAPALPKGTEAAAAMTPRQDSSSSSQAGRTGRQHSLPRLDPPSQPSSGPPIAGLGSRSEPGSSTALSVGSRAPSVPLTQKPSMQSFSSLSVNPNMSSQSLTSLASGSVAASDFRSPSPGVRATPSSSQTFDAASVEAGNSLQQEVMQLRQQLQRQEVAHAEEMKQLEKEHAANKAAVQSQAVNKMKELIEKVCSDCTLFCNKSPYFPF